MANAMKRQADAADRMLQHIQGDRDDRPQGHRARDGDYHGWAEFQKAKPPTFRGEFNPTLAEEWIQELEKLFKVLRCSVEQKVEYAISMLASEAENWWKGARELMEARGTQITWENFKISFFEKYYPASVRNQKEIEFMQMKQGNMPFEEFIAKYEESSNFSSYRKHYADEARKAMHVKAALNTTKRNVIAPLDIKNYAELVNRCRIVARNIKVAEKVKQGTNFSNKSPMNFSKGGSSKGKTPMVSKSAPNSCPNCGKTHGGRPCLFGSNVYYSCGQTGHYARDCPQNKQASALFPQILHFQIHTNPHRRTHSSRQTDDTEKLTTASGNSLVSRTLSPSRQGLRELASSSGRGGPWGGHMPQESRFLREELLGSKIRELIEAQLVGTTHIVVVQVLNSTKILLKYSEKHLLLI
ncbi:hypothetical protein G2W53_044506 [Senna tora]|uniref:CCHC-type domain-containing protein n=1 Tax=Senna tora TaxID=362788 RepID=A0A834SD78_9FABA|nr:hypothetical protein G2W53_044506 [Senna tora]